MPGPAKGHGGRPRRRNKPRPGDGYRRVTVGPPGRGTQTYEHRDKLGLKKGNKMTAQHKDHNTSNNSMKNLVPMSKGANTAESNRRRKRY